jgi:ATP-dependent protease HslVU (ClpYQ) peptidase subunit
MVVKNGAEMTCIVAVKHNKEIYMGGDSLGSDTSFHKTVRNDPKVFINGEMLFGFTTSFRMGQILEYVMEAPERPEGISDMKYLVSHWIPTLIECFSDNGYRGDVEATDHDETKLGGEFLLGYRGTLYQIESDFQVGIPKDQYAAAGCGQDLALGSVYTSKLCGVTDPEEIIKNALSAAEKFSAGVQRPFLILSI